MRRYATSETKYTQQKDDWTLVTAADTEINKMVSERATKEFPAYSIHGEEVSLHVENPQATWVCDPVDGTMPFAKGLPSSTFSLGLVNLDGESVAGVVYDPFYDRLFEAVKGSGAKLNGTPIRVSDKKKLADRAYIDNELWVNEQEGVSFNDPRDKFNKLGAWTTSYCSVCIAGALVAQGELDAMLFGQTKPEDIAALAVIVTEAGGKVTDMFGCPQRYNCPICGAIVSNGIIHDELVSLLADIEHRNPYSLRR